MFEVLAAIVIFVILYTVLDLGMIISGIGTVMLLGVFNITVNDEAKTEFDQVAGITEEVAHSPNRPYREPAPEPEPAQESDATYRYTSRTTAPSDTPTVYINNGIRDKWLAVDLWRTNDGIAACYTDNDPGTNCFVPILRRHTDGALYACIKDGNCNIVKE